jgi:hypothetical protein
MGAGSAAGWLSRSRDLLSGRCLYLCRQHCDMRQATKTAIHSEPPSTELRTIGSTVDSPWDDAAKYHFDNINNNDNNNNN